MPVATNMPIFEIDTPPVQPIGGPAKIPAFGKLFNICH